MFSNLKLFLLISFSTTHAMIHDHSAYYEVHFGPILPCKAYLIGTPENAELRKCARFAEDEDVTKPAKVKELNLKLVVSSAGEIGLEISFEAVSPASSQSYCIEVRSENRKVFCGILHTPTPQKQVIQNFTLLMTCGSNDLIPRAELGVTVNPSRETMSKNLKRAVIRIPECADSSIIFRSNECKDFRENTFIFNVQQVSNDAILAAVDKKSTYSGNRSIKVSMQLRLQREGMAMNGWEPVGDVVRLVYPETEHRFGNLTSGETYSVLFWRSSSDRRFFDTVTLKTQFGREKRHAGRLITEYER